MLSIRLRSIVERANHRPHRFWVCLYHEAIGRKGRSIYVLRFLGKDKQPRARQLPPQQAKVIPVEPWEFPHTGQGHRFVNEIGKYGRMKNRIQ